MLENFILYDIIIKGKIIMSFEKSMSFKLSKYIQNLVYKSFCIYKIKKHRLKPYLNLKYIEKEYNF